MEYNYTLYDGKNSPPLRLYAVQGEAGARTFTLEIVGKDGRSPVGLSSQVFAYVAKNDRTLVMIECQTSSGTVTFTLPLQACTCPGENRMYLQILDGDTEIRWDNLLLYVEPCDLENAVESTTDLGVLGDLLEKADTIDDLTELVMSTAKELERVLEKYSDELRPFTFGVGDNGCQFITGIDSSGVMFELDMYHQNGEGSLFSTDFGASWQRFTYGSDSQNMTAEVFIAGKRLLVMDKKYLCWGSVSGNKVVFEEPVSHSLYSNVNPVFEKRGIYAAGKYLFLLNVSEFVENPVGQNLYYLEEGGISPVQVKFPEERMRATAVGYDPISGKFIAAGRYAYTLEDDEYNHNAWAAVSEDLSSWEMVYQDSGDKANYFVSAVAYKGKFYLAPFGSFNQSVWLITIDTQTHAQDQIVIPTEETFYTVEISAITMGISLLNSQGLLAFSEDGQTFRFSQTKVLGGTLSYLSGWERYLLLGSGNKLAAYRMDLVGENLVENLEKIQESYEQALRSVKETENALGIWEAYDSKKDYIPLNKVSYEGNSYVNIKPCRGIPPTDEENWLLIAKKGDKGDLGNKGDPGPQGQAASISVGNVQTGLPGGSAAVVNTGTSSAAVLDFVIPQGKTGKAATVQVGTVVTGDPGTLAQVENTGTENAAVLKFVIPQGNPGQKGDKGDPGKGFVVLGYYETLEALQMAHPTAQAGDAYGVGIDKPYDIYLWDGIHSVWVNNGPLKGATGDKGENGGYYTPSVDESGNLNWTGSEQSMAPVPGANIRGPQGNPGPTGSSATINGVSSLILITSGGIEGVQSGDTYTLDGSNFIRKSQKAIPNGVATLGADGKLSDGQMPDASKVPYTNVSMEGVTNVQQALDSFQTSLTKVDDAVLTYGQQVVETTAWIEDQTLVEAGYGYRASVPLASMTGSHVPTVNFSASDASGRNLAPVSDSYDGGVYIFAKTIPDAAVTIVSVEGLKGVNTA